MDERERIVNVFIDQLYPRGRPGKAALKDLALVANDLLKAGHDSDAALVACHNWHSLFPGATRTARAVLKHIDLLLNAEVNRPQPQIRQIVEQRVRMTQNLTAGRTAPQYEPPPHYTVPKGGSP